MRKLIGVTAVIALLVVAFSAPVSAQAGGVVLRTCSELTTFTQPTDPPPYRMDWRGFQHRVVVKGSVTAVVTGTCRGFVTGLVTVRVKRPNGTINQRSEAYEHLEFKNGFNDTGQPFTFTFSPLFGGNLKKPGTCVSVTVQWEPWRYNDNELVPNGPAKTMRSSGCFRKT